ncbi:hypothetical protein UY3_08812 [Chelonia mydas]|uniref:Uncharacterized protein n=1 Tax=Chelonia mydas TaxID=8469 RepID=M7B7X6_CHEMY|nr:hypothetical protein UY3_08812 [Chelonia mydas]
MRYPHLQAPPPAAPIGWEWGTMANGSFGGGTRRRWQHVEPSASPSHPRGCCGTGWTMQSLMTSNRLHVDLTIHFMDWIAGSGFKIVKLSTQKSENVSTLNYPTGAAWPEPDDFAATAISDSDTSTDAPVLDEVKRAICKLKNGVQPLLIASLQSG